MFKIHNPYTGLYVDAYNIDELTQAMAEQAWAAYMNLTHGQPFAVVEIQPNGGQIWKTPDGNQIPSPQEVEEKLKKFADTKFGTLPLLILGEAGA